MSDHYSGHSAAVRVGELAPIVHVRRLRIDPDGKRQSWWMHQEGAYTLRACDCNAPAPEAPDKPCPRKHDPIERYRNGKGWLCCRVCERIHNREYARKRRAAA